MKNKFIIGIDLGGTSLKTALFDARLKLISRKSFNTKSFDNKEKLVAGIVKSIEALAEEKGLSWRGIAGIGIGLPGPVDNLRGIVRFLPNIRGWKNVRLKNILENKFSFPVFLDNDAKLMALAEHALGRAKGANNALCVTLGTGVGGALILEGKLFRGKDNAAGEIGHLPINVDGPFCNCGGKACLEAYIGNARIALRARKLFGRRITLEELSGLAARKNKLAIALWQEVGSQLGVALSGMVNLLNLDSIVIGGGVANAGGMLFSRVKKTIKERAMSVQAKRVRVLKAALGSDAGVIGAAVLVKERLGYAI